MCTTNNLTTRNYLNQFYLGPSRDLFSEWTSPDHPQRLEKNLEHLEKNLTILENIANAEHQKNFKTVHGLIEDLDPQYQQRLMHGISIVGFLSKEMILQVQAEVCVELLLESIHKENSKRVSELLDQLIFIHPRNTELFKFLCENCGQPNHDQCGEHAFHNRAGYFASVSDKENALLKFKEFLQESWNKDLPLLDPIPVSLEKEFEDLGCCLLDRNKLEGAGVSFLDPNEENPQEIAPHLLEAQKLQRGVLVSPGPERSFFGLCFSNEKTCQGLFIRDINEKVKAYSDCNILLLRISDDIDEYIRLSQKLNLSGMEFVERMEIIRSKLNTACLDEKMKNYYLYNLYNLCHVYFGVTKSWRNESIPSGLNRGQFFEKCRYDLDQNLFSKLQKYAKSGNIVCMTGDMNDLSILKTRKIPVIDTSNIHDYTLLDFKKVTGNFCPRIIWTSLHLYRRTEYFSCIFQPLKDEENSEFDQLVNKLETAYGITNSARWALVCPAAYGRQKSNNNHPLHSPMAIPSRSKDMLDTLREYTRTYLLKVPRLELVDICPISRNIVNLNRLTDQEINEVCQNPDTKNFLDILAQQWPLLDPRIFLAFTQIEGWKERMEIGMTHCQNNKDSVKIFLEKLLQDKSYPQKFIVQFGEQMLNNLLKEYLDSSK
jgi:hypothetical protein